MDHCVCRDDFTALTQYCVVWEHDFAPECCPVMDMLKKQEGFEVPQKRLLACFFSSNNIEQLQEILKLYQ